MGFKTIDRSTNFSDCIFKKSLNDNIYLTGLASTTHAIDGSRADVFLTIHDPVSTSNPGVGAYPSAVFNCLGKMRGDAYFQKSQVWSKRGDIEVR